MTEGSEHTGEILTEQAKEADVYWLCECGVARLNSDKLEPHLDAHNHYAEKIDSTNGRVKGFMAGGLDNKKYADQIPGNAQIKREKRKNDPMFER